MSLADRRVKPLGLMRFMKQDVLTREVIESFSIKARVTGNADDEEAEVISRPSMI